MTERQLKELSAIKNPVCKEAAEFIRIILESPHYESYVSIKVMMANLNEDLKSDRITLLNIASKGDGDDKTFLYAHKYATEIKFYHEQLEYLRMKMLPEQIIQAEVEGNSLIDQARILKNRNGKV